MKTLLTTGWNFMRMFRLIMGIVALTFAFSQRDTLLGGFLILMAIFNTGCCGASCAIPTRGREAKQEETKMKSHEEND